MNIFKNKYFRINIFLKINSRSQVQPVHEAVQHYSSHHIHCHQHHSVLCDGLSLHQHEEPDSTNEKWCGRRQGKPAEYV